jgi:hypothetical protein
MQIPRDMQSWRCGANAIRGAADAGESKGPTTLLYYVRPNDFVSFAQNSYPTEYVSVLANGVVSRVVENRNACMTAFTGLIRVCLAEQVYGDDVDAYIRAQGRTAPRLTKVDPRGDKEQTRIFKQFRETEATDVFIDEMRVGSLVWSEFEASSIDSPQMNSKTLEKLAFLFKPSSWPLLMIFTASVTYYPGCCVTSTYQIMAGGSGNSFRRNL